MQPVRRQSSHAAREPASCDGKLKPNPGRDAGSPRAREWNARRDRSGCQLERSPRSNTNAIPERPHRRGDRIGTASLSTIQYLIMTSSARTGMLRSSPRPPARFRVFCTSRFAFFSSPGCLGVCDRARR
ncbi:hypothetical protein BD309DRAFT_970648 [Dichomitus squalens]|uniref:Uncharacterized protein n=1 Tax=Dichomitus squalens TaxID=114155 RepID=A0A4Q9PAP6_9APHY|nr:hypothetical protein BD309DRAFT_970648 [Dichomitus squalens]TBU51770.1 hypothetical protein BD310DRAFT_941647 [Dichomitus squalens]